MFTFAVTAYNEMTEPQLHGQRLLNCVRAAQAHEAISEIVVVDDGSPNFDRLEELLRDASKVKLFRNDSRMGVFTNKVEIIARSTGDWVITCDSDNVMGPEFIDQIVGTKRDERTWYCSSFGRPHFDYRKLVGTYDWKTIGSILDLRAADCAVNTGNQTVHRESFMRVFGRYRQVLRFDLLLPNYMDLPESERQENCWWLAYGACDSILFNLEWMQNGGQMAIVLGLEHLHHVHSHPEGSNFNRAPDEKGAISKKLIELMRQGA